MTSHEHTLDATNKSLGRIASQAAHLLMGKNTTNFTRNEITDVVVTITNASQAKISSKKMDEKIYMSYSGYPGGRTDRTMRRVIDEKGYKEIFKRAVYGMLPENRLRSRMMKKLIIEE